jgi:hypothetical protein
MMDGVGGRGGDDDFGQHCGSTLTADDQGVMGMTLRVVMLMMMMTTTTIMTGVH